jgi:hypothetical protein
MCFRQGEMAILCLKIALYILMFFGGSTALTAFPTSKRSDLQKAIFACLVSAPHLSHS